MLCLAIVVFSNSGGPLACTLIAVIGCLMWRWRTGMSTVRWSMVTALVVLGIAMQAPLWYLPAKMSELTGGDGWHRSYLIEVAFDNVDQWWLFGMPASGTTHWFPYRLASNQADIINYYVAFGISGGMLAAALSRAAGPGLQPARPRDGSAQGHCRCRSKSRALSVVTRRRAVCARIQLVRLGLF